MLNSFQLICLLIMFTFTKCIIHITACASFILEQLPFFIFFPKKLFTISKVFKTPAFPICVPNPTVTYNITHTHIYFLIAEELNV